MSLFTEDDLNFIQRYINISEKQCNIAVKINAHENEKNTFINKEILLSHLQNIAEFLKYLRTIYDQIIHITEFIKTESKHSDKTVRKGSLRIILDIENDLNNRFEKTENLMYKIKTHTQKPTIKGVYSLLIESTNNLNSWKMYIYDLNKNKIITITKNLKTKRYNINDIIKKLKIKSLNPIMNLT